MKIDMKLLLDSQRKGGFRFTSGGGHAAADEG